jgi:glutamate/tyrosine decarboxylase-like PLP-dependent enzyme
MAAMNTQLKHDRDDLHALLSQTMERAYRHLASLNDIPPATERPRLTPPQLPEGSMGAAAALEMFSQRVGQMAAFSGPRYWGFVTGGTTPAALMGDWLTSAYDVNLVERENSAAPLIEQDAIALLRQLFGLPDTFMGVFVSGAMLSNFSGLAMGREWVGQKLGVSVAAEGLYRLPAFKVLSTSPHSTSIKALAMLGMGRAIHAVEKLPGNREAMDVADLERQLIALNGEPCIVIANSGTVNTTDFDDLNAIAALKQGFPFWLHVDAAFGGFAACSPRYRHLMAGVEAADSLTIDAHKWLNVPYDSAMIFTRHRKLQTAVFQNVASYLPDLGDDPDFLHLTPESSRRFRALPAWFTLMAYGRQGYQDIVEQNCDLAAMLGQRIEASQEFTLLAPVRLNIACFALRSAMGDSETGRKMMADFLHRLRDSGRVYMTPTTYNGVAGIRAAFSNWRTTAEDIDIAWQAMQDAMNTA